jgi:hypothetical protein
MLASTCRAPAPWGVCVCVCVCVCVSGGNKETVSEKIRRKRL